MGLPTGTRAVNLGCGVTVAPGWINVDNSPNARLAKYPALRWGLWKAHLLSDAHYRVPWPQGVHLHDLRTALPFADDSIDWVYSSHVLEHLRRQHASNLVGEVRRVLKPGGVVRLVVPDLALGARRYLDRLAAHPDDGTAAPTFLSWMQLSQPGTRAPHLWMYDAASLSALLRETGMTAVTVY